MTVTAASFVAAYPEFRFAPGAPGQAGSALTDALARAEAHIADDWEATQRDAAVMLQAADDLAMSPFGRDAQIIPEGTKTSVYRLRLWLMMKAHAWLNPNRWGTL